MAPSSQSSQTKQTTLFGFFGKANGAPPTPARTPSNDKASTSTTPSGSTTKSTIKKTPARKGGGEGFSSPLLSKSRRPGKVLKRLNSEEEPIEIDVDKDRPEEDTDVFLKSSKDMPILPSSSQTMVDMPSSSRILPSSKRPSSTSNGKKSELSSSPLSEIDESTAMEVDEDLNRTPTVSKKPLPLVMEEEEEEESPIKLQGRGRHSKRKVVYAETDSGSDSDVSIKNKPTTASGSAKKRKLRKGADDDDDFELAEGDATLIDEGEGEEDFEMDDFGLDEDALAAAMDDFEQTPKKPSVPKSTPTSRSRFAYDPSAPSSSTPKRPPPKPLGAKKGSNQPSGSAGGFMTQAERGKIEAREKKKAEESCFEFLKDLKDKEGHRVGDPEYDGRTVHIPNKAWNTFSPFEKQFWEIKQNHFDTVLFFQKGKFYELYENDAEIGHAEFDLKLTDRVKMKMVGVPEASFDWWAAKFLAAGYKVGKVEQAETAIGMEMRNKANVGSKEKSKSDGIVRRELASVFTNGTVVDEAFLTEEEASHCVAIKEGRSADGSKAAYGVCILDAATGQFELSCWEDDNVGTRLETLTRQLRIKELLHEKGNLTVTTMRLLRNALPMNTSWVSLKPETEFMPFENTVQELNTFFESESGDAQIPDAIAEMVAQNQVLTIEALGGMIFYLRSLNMATDLLSQKSFNIYDPIRKGEGMVLDGQTLSHLEILLNNEGGDEGTLLQLLQRCITPFGKRLFRIWLTVPLRDVSAINARLDAVEDLMNHPTFSETFGKIARGVPDLERLISRIHAGRCKQSDFLKVVDAFDKISNGFEKLAKASEDFETNSVSGLIRGCPDLTSFRTNLKKLYRLEEGCIQPRKGASVVCDEAAQAVDEAEAALDDKLEQYKTKTKCKSLTFWHSAQGQKEIYHIQAPASGFSAPGNWTKTSGTKAYNRYVTSETLPLIRITQEARETRKIAFAEFYGTLMAEFDNDRETWLKAVRVLAELDCLLSLAKASADMDEPKVRPEIVESDAAFIDFIDLRHPCMSLRTDFIANDIKLGGDLARQVLLTGPNTAGKSTLMRSTAMGIILCQLGCFVPATQARISPVDRIATRMGAYDAIFSGRSTFAVEMDEAKKILTEAGPKAMTILDELGRGTATFDGQSLAEAILHQLATHTLPIGFFSTHYHTLTEAYLSPKPHPNVRCQHMATHVNDERREVIPLYKLIDGVAESSFGTHVAHLAGVPESIVTRAESVSKKFFADLQNKLMTRRHSKLSAIAQADFAFLVNACDPERNTLGNDSMKLASLSAQLNVIRRSIA